jgi:hypothetical protein
MPPLKECTKFPPVREGDEDEVVVSSEAAEVAANGYTQEASSVLAGLVEDTAAAAEANRKHRVLRYRH